MAALPRNLKIREMAQSTSNTDWQTGMSRISQRAGYLLQSGQWSDCTFIVGSGNNQKTLQAHRLILAMSSPVFEAMFFGGMAEKGDKPVEILDVQPQAFKALLQYIYSDEINLKSFDQVCEICYAAKKYMIPSLVEQCTQFIWSDLHPGNVCRAFEFARLFEEPLLLEKCLQIICTKTEDVLKDSSFEEVEIGTLRTMLKQDSLTASELVLWEACLRWTKQECCRMSLEVTPMNQRKVLGDCLGLIRFLTLSPTEFANGPAVSGLLVQEESFTLLMNISSPGVTTIPSPFSQSLKRRVKVRVPSPPSAAPSNSRSTGPLVQNMQLRCVCTGDILAGILVNEKLLDCMLSFSVDRDVCIYGVEMLTQCLQQSLEDQQPPTQGAHECYYEIIYAFLQDSDGSRITHTHFTARVPYSSSMEVMFNRPAYILRNKMYRIGVVLNKEGRYPAHVIIPYVTVNEFTFTFDRERSRNGLITAVIFGCFSPPEPTPRQEHNWMPMY
ncbi:BTB/POZ domain-containing protein 2-like isoform X2 [Macrobrachium nipponense]|uniref:BTB/POZ domain-containing protein 2-like isoform X2 n=1 Tax=Macrobrachium nipponense TaxID=159736 RepID=UPI0030C8D1A6